MDKIIKEAREFVKEQVMPVVRQQSLVRRPNKYEFKVGFTVGEEIGREETIEAVREQLRVEQSVSLYAHMPLCSARCRYCHYPVVVGGLGCLGRFVERLVREADLFLEQVPELAQKVMTSLYIGGGTPTLMSAEQIQRLLGCLRSLGQLAPDVEVTFEGSPESWTPNKIECAKAAGVTRPSVGVQILNDEYLRWLGRRHTVQEALDAITRLVSAEFESVNVDLIYGFPNQSVKKFAEDVRAIADLGPHNITLYRLRLGRGKSASQLLRYYRQHPDEFPTQEETYVMQVVGRMILLAAGYVEGPVGWYAKPGFVPQVYRDRWIEQVPLVGFGWSAYSYGKTYEYHNFKSLKSYLGELGQGQLPIERGWVYSREEQQKRASAFRRKAMASELTEVEKVVVEEMIK